MTRTRSARGLEREKKFNFFKDLVLLFLALPSAAYSRVKKLNLLWHNMYVSAAGRILIERVTLLGTWPG